MATAHSNGQTSITALVGKDEILAALKCATIESREFRVQAWSLADVQDLQTVVEFLERRFASHRTTQSHIAKYAKCKDRKNIPTNKEAQHEHHGEWRCHRRMDIGR